MTTILAIWKIGVFEPDDSLDLMEGARVELQVTPTSMPELHSVRSKATAPLPDQPSLCEARSAPFDLPMPATGHIVRARTGSVLLPDAHDVAE